MADSTNAETPPDEEAKQALASLMKRKDENEEAAAKTAGMDQFTVTGAVQSIVEYKERPSVTIELGGFGATLSDIAEGKIRHPASTFGKSAGTFVEPVPLGTIAETRKGMPSEVMAYSVLLAVDGQDVTGLPHDEIKELILTRSMNEQRSQAVASFSLTFQKPLWLSWWQQHAQLTEEQVSRLYAFCRCFTDYGGGCTDHLDHRDTMLAMEWDMIEITEEQTCLMMEAAHRGLEQGGKAFFLKIFPHDVGLGPIWFPGPCRRGDFNDRTKQAIAATLQSLKTHGMMK